MREESAFSAVFCTGEDSTELLDQVARLRKTIFVDRRGWDLPTVDDRELDAFDGPGTIYAALFEERRLCGTFRAIRTDEPYLAQKVFPRLASLRPYPQRIDAWEISRFGILPDGNSRKIGSLNYALMFWFALRVRASALIAIADLTYERFLGSLGIRTRRYGAPQIIGADRRGHELRAVAGEISLPAQDPRRLSSLLSLLDNVEISFASNVFGPARLSTGSTRFHAASGM